MKITMKHETVGPSYDPYGRDTLEVKTAFHKAVWVSCGLAGESIRLYRGNGACGWVLVREHKVEQVFGFGGPRQAELRARARQSRLKAEILFRRWVGISRDAAHEQHESSYGGDPFGGRRPVRRA